MLMHGLAAAALGATVGIALGLTGGGGSIFAMPALIYGLGVAPAVAVPISLVAVGATALVGAVQSLRRGLIVWQPSLLFAVGGVVGAPFGTAIGRRIEPSWLIAGFAVLALVVGSIMWRLAGRAPGQSTAVRARTYEEGGGPICVLSPDGQLRFSTPCALVLAVLGLATGVLSGLFGVGGGFLIVPALVLVTRMGVHRAVATSLLVISVIGLAGAAGAFMQQGIAWGVLLPFAFGGAVAMIASRAFAARVAGPTLQRVFAFTIVLVGISMLVESLM